MKEYIEREAVEEMLESAQTIKGVCPNCHRLDSIDPLARYCRYCGAKLAQEDGHEVH